MRYIRNLSQETLKLLDKIYKKSKYYQVRQRAHCLILSFQGCQISELMKIFKVSRNTIYNWFNNWESNNLPSLYNNKGRGRKKSFNFNQQNIIKEWVKETPKKLNKVKEKIEIEWGIKTSIDTIKRIIKSFQMGWYRIKKTIAGEPLASFYKKK